MATFITRGRPAASASSRRGTFRAGLLQAEHHAALLHRWEDRGDDGGNVPHTEENGGGDPETTDGISWNKFGKKWSLIWQHKPLLHDLGDSPMFDSRLELMGWWVDGHDVSLRSSVPQCSCGWITLGPDMFAPHLCSFLAGGWWGCFYIPSPSNIFQYHSIIWPAMLAIECQTMPDLLRGFHSWILRLFQLPGAFGFGLETCGLWCSHWALLPLCHLCRGGLADYFWVWEEIGSTRRLLDSMFQPTFEGFRKEEEDIEYMFIQECTYSSKRWELYMDKWGCNADMRCTGSCTLFVCIAINLWTGNQSVYGWLLAYPTDCFRSIECSPHSVIFFHGKNRQVSPFWFVVE